MTVRLALRASAVCALLAGCAAPGDYYDNGTSYSGPSYGPSDSSSSSGPSSGYSSEERSYVDRQGNTVFHKHGETTVVEPDGDVTVIDRDPDGTRTIVDSDGSVRVLTPDHNCIGDC